MQYFERIDLINVDHKKRNNDAKTESDQERYDVTSELQ